MSFLQPLIQGFRYLVSNFFRESRGSASIAGLFVQHLQLLGISLGIALLIAIPVSILVTRVRWLRGPVLSVLGVIYTIPSLSMFVLLIPLFGIGIKPAIIALVAYAQLVLVRNTVVGLSGIDPAILEAARGMGMNSLQRFWRVELAAGAAADSGRRTASGDLDHWHRHHRGVHQRGRPWLAAVPGRVNRQSRADRGGKHCHCCALLCC